MPFARLSFGVRRRQGSEQSTHRYFPLSTIFECPVTAQNQPLAKSYTERLVMTQSGRSHFVCLSVNFAHNLHDFFSQKSSRTPGEKLRSKLIKILLLWVRLTQSKKALEWVNKIYHCEDEHPCAIFLTKFSNRFSSYFKFDTH